ncbi:hypothetical protein M8J76_001647 [Diaphorina citri]|nr:hypothetical protein M8J76_001647 [Diaphorina citri]
MTSMKELFAVPPKATKNFIAMNVKNIHKRQENANKSSKIVPKPQTRIPKETNGPIIRNSSKLSNYRTYQSSEKHKPKAYRHAGCQTIDFENNESLLEDGVIRYPSSKWKERATQELQFKSIALQTEPKPKFDTNFHIIGSSSNEEVDDIVEIDGERPPCDKNHEKNGSNLVLEENMKRLNIKHMEDQAETHKTKKQNQSTTCSKLKSKAVRDTNTISGSTTSLNDNRTNNTSTQCKVPTTYKRGTVPRYLVEKKLEQEKEQRRILEEAERTGILDPDCPPGHILLPTEKRLEQLEFLKRNYKNLINELNRIPVRNDSLKIRQHRVVVEKELDKLEEAIKLFSKEKLFVKP